MSLVVSTALCVAGCGHEVHAVEEKGVLRVTSPTRKPAELTRDYVAQIRTIQHIELRALAKGYLQGVFVDEGQHVTKGQRMFQILPVVYQAEVGKAAAEAERAKIEYGNTKLLAESKVVSPSELSLAKAVLDKAQAELELASQHRGFTEIRAPFSGIMGRFHVRQGSLIDEGDPMTTLSDNSTMWVYFNVAESEYLRFQAESSRNIRRPVRLQLANGELFDQVGRIETIEADFDHETGTIAFRAAFPNPKGLLRHGQTGKILMTQTLDNALIIPQKATFEVLDKRFVFVVGENNVVQSRPITVSAELPQVYVVSEGLTEKDHILIDGLRKVRDGDVIEPEFQEPTDVLARLVVPAE